MDVSFFKLLIFTSSFVNFSECGDEISYRFSDYKCQDYRKKFDESIKENYTEFNYIALDDYTQFFTVKDYRFKIGLFLYEEGYFNYTIVAIDVKHQKNETFTMRFGASKNPNLIEKEKKLKLCDSESDLFNFNSNDLIGEWLYDWYNWFADCSFSSNLSHMRLSWKAPIAPVVDQIFIYFELNGAHPKPPSFPFAFYTSGIPYDREYVFKKSIIINPQAFTNDENFQKIDQEFEDECTVTENKQDHLVEEDTSQNYVPIMSGSSVPKIITVLIYSLCCICVWSYSAGTNML